VSSIARGRIQDIVDGALSDWHKTKERLTSLEDSKWQDRSYYVKVRKRDFFGPVQSNQQQTRLEVEVELGRFLGGGNALQYDIESLRDSLDTSAYNVNLAMELPSNWDYTNSGIVLVNHLGGEEVSKEEFDERTIVHVIRFEAIVRTPPPSAGSGSLIELPNGTISVCNCSGGGGSSTTNHAAFSNLDYDNSGHTGFLSSTAMWDDFKLFAQGVNPPGAATDPNISQITGLWEFQSNRTAVLAGTAQFPHNFVPSIARPHFHFRSKSDPAGSGDTYWRFEYLIYTATGLVPNSYTAEDAIVNVLNHSGGQAYAQIFSFSNVDISSLDDSSFIDWRLSRIPGEAADVYSDSVVVVDLDMHVQIDSLGSVEEFPS
jgi:hypothetical protein